MFNWWPVFFFFIIQNDHDNEVNYYHIKNLLNENYENNESNENNENENKYENVYKVEKDENEFEYRYQNYKRNFC